jgi:hypothetical protein
MVDAANMLPPWDNIRRLGKPRRRSHLHQRRQAHARSPVFGNPRRAPGSDSVRLVEFESPLRFGRRPIKVGREEMVTAWLTAEKYSRLDFDAIDRPVRQAGRVPGEGTRGSARSEAGAHACRPDTQDPRVRRALGRESPGDHGRRCRTSADGRRARALRSDEPSLRASS